MKLAKILSRKNGERKTQPEDLKAVEQRLNQVERKITEQARSQAR